MKSKALAIMTASIVLLMASSAAAQPAMYPPWTCDETYQITQGNNGKFSHTAGSYDQYAWDIGMPEGTDVLAPAAGVIRALKNDSAKGCCQYSCVDMANYVHICYDGTYGGVFYHLKDVTVSVGQHVNQGDLIGHSGDTGFSCGPHLHYAISKCSSMYQSIAASWAGFGVPIKDQYIKSNNCPVTCTPSPEICDGKDNDCDGKIDEDDVCIEATELKYQAMLYDRQNTDINGDGKADICARGASGLYCAFSEGDHFGAPKLVIPGLKNDNGWTDTTDSNTIRFADVNGDKKADACVRTDDGIECWLSTGDGFGERTKALGAFSNANGYKDTQYISTMRFADINGDGKDDFCARFKDRFKCFLSNGNGFDKEVSFDDLGDSTGWNKPQYGSTIRMGDVDGDGKMDVCARGVDVVYCWFSNGESWSGEVELNPSTKDWSNANGWTNQSYYSTIRMADINGDGKMDLCGRDKNGIVCMISAGRAPAAKIVRGPAWSDANGWGDYDHYSTIMYADLNGDGKDDICGRANAVLECYLSNGNGFDTNPITVDEFSDKNGWNKPTQFRTLRMGDINGDGRMDVCGRASDGVKCYLSNGTGFTKVTGATPTWDDAGDWSKPFYYATMRFGGPLIPCAQRKEICGDNIDNNCNGQIDEGEECNPNPDNPNPDNPNPDNPNPDNPNPGEQNPDTPNPDEQNPDTPNPDTPNPDEQNPDTPNPDEQNPDTPNPDEQNPDTPNPDEQNPDESGTANKGDGNTESGTDSDNEDDSSDDANTAIKTAGDCASTPYPSPNAPTGLLLFGLMGLIAWIRRRKVQ